MLRNWQGIVVSTFFSKSHEADVTHCSIYLSHKTHMALSSFCAHSARVSGLNDHMLSKVMSLGLLLQCTFIANDRVLPVNWAIWLFVLTVYLYLLP